MDDVSMSHFTVSEHENQMVTSFVAIVDALCSSLDDIDMTVFQKTIAERENEAADVESVRIEVSMMKPSETITQVDEVFKEIRKEDQHIQVTAEKEVQSNFLKAEKEKERESYAKLSRTQND